MSKLYIYLFIPLVFALLPLKTDECYNKMRDLLINACTTRNFTFQPEVVHIDFEYAMHSAVTNKFPNATIIYCIENTCAKSFFF
jgi:hypothetical protein